MCKKTILIFFIILITRSYGYVLTKSNLGQTVKWPGANLDLLIYSNLSGNVEQIFLNSVTEWNNKSNLKILVRGSLGGNDSTWIGNGYNDIGYSKNLSYFKSNCAVLGVTTLIYDPDGEILEADILLNGFSGCFSEDSREDNYIGNVITHELGHFVGLAHNETIHSTMYYKATVGQYTLSSDDKAGVYSIYPNGNKGKISGRVVGGDNLVGIFGAHVMAISIKTGEVLASVLSRPSGEFSIEGIDVKADDRYYLYITPYKGKENLSSYYYNIRNNFCYSNMSYRGSFFQACGSASKGYPYGVKASADNQNISVGNITIRCNLDVSNDYLAHKPDTSNEIDLIDNEGYIGTSLIGFFTKKYNYNGDTLESIELDGEDKYHLDLSSIDFAQMVNADEAVFLEYRILSQDIFSKLVTKVSINEIEQNYIYTDLDNTVKFVSSGRVEISKTNYSYNIFDITVSPLNKWGKCTDSLILDTTDLCPINGYSSEQIYPMDAGIYDPLNFYFIEFHVSKKKNYLSNLSSNYFAVSYKNFEENAGNNSCADGPNAYEISAYTPEALGGLLTKRKSDGDLMACGTIDLDDPGGPSNNILSLILGFLVILAFQATKKLKGY